MGFVSEPITDKQLKYIEILLNDVGLHHHRKDMLQLRFKKDHISDLSKHEAYLFIAELKETKANQKGFDPGDRHSAFRND